MTIYTGSWPTGGEGSTGDTCGVIYDGRYYIGVKFDAGWKYSELGGTSDMLDLKALVTDGWKIKDEYGTDTIYLSSSKFVSKNDILNKTRINVVDNARHLDYTMSIKSLFGYSFIKNEEYDSTLPITNATPITVTAIDTTAHTMTLSYIPYISSIDNPVTNHEWALNRLDSWSGTDPSRTGDYADQVIITSVDRSTNKISYDATRIHGADTNWVVGDKVAFYNPFVEGTGFIYSDAIITKSSGFAESVVRVNSGPIFKHSAGYYILLVTAYTSAGHNKVFAFKTTDFATWTILNSGDAVFIPSGVSGDWRELHIAAHGSVHNIGINKYIVYVTGGNSSKNSIGWVLFDEDFSAVEYSSAEIIDSSASSLGLQAPSVIRYGAEWRMLYTDRDDNANPDLSTNPWTLKEATASSPLGPFVYQRTVLKGRDTTDLHDGVGNITGMQVGYWYHFVQGTAGHDLTVGSKTYSATCYFIAEDITGSISSGDANDHVTYAGNDGTYWNSHADASLLFIYKGILYALIGGTSRFGDSGTAGNRVYGLFSWNGSSWVEDNRNPIIINPFYANYLWTDVDGDDHLGGYPSMIVDNDNGYLYIFMSASSAASSGEYFVVAYKKDISSIKL